MRMVSPGFRVTPGMVRRVELSPLGRMEGRLASASQVAMGWLLIDRVNLAEPPWRSKYWTAIE